MSKGTATRSRVIDSAIGLINRKGIRNTSVRDVIEETGVKKGNLYFHFSSKDELCAAIIGEAAERYFNYLSKSITSDRPLGKISDILTAVLEYHRKRKFDGGCIFGNTALETSDTDEAYAEMVRGVFDRWVRILAGLLREAARRGELPAGIRPEPMARHIVAAMEGGIMMARLYKREAPLMECVGYLRTLLGIK
jgi:TetR/AcrR family transcriptional regulator, transcriptional repressor for nem operon